jgi:hypothetical protein
MASTPSPGNLPPDAPPAELLSEQSIDDAHSSRPDTSGNTPVPAKKKLSLHEREFFHTIEEWEQIDLDTEDNAVLIGTPTAPIIRPGTKNIVEAPEKTYKTTTLLRLAIGMACGHTVFPSLPVARPVRVLYFHGEMTPKELEERRNAALYGISEAALTQGRRNFIDGRCIGAHLINKPGQDDIRRIVNKFKPQVLVLDPWQSFISGCDENLFKDVSRATEFLDQLITGNNGLTVFMPTHTGKDHSRGVRGHSSLSGWRDTLIRLTKKDTTSINVVVSPRWSAPVSLKLKFANGTMSEGKMFTPQTTKIRAFVEEKKRPVKKEEIEAFLGGAKDATRKAISRAVDEKAIYQIQAKDERFGMYVRYVDDEDIFPSGI